MQQGQHTLDGVHGFLTQAIGCMGDGRQTCLIY